MKFVLGITNYERLDYLKRLISTWEETKSDNEWRLIIADDGSGANTHKYFNELEGMSKDYALTIIRHKDVGVHNLTNAIFKDIDGTDFDFCFKLDNDMYFKKPGWDLKYYEAAIKTGYHHLIYNRNGCLKEDIMTTSNKKSIRMGGVPMMYGCFYTVTQDILNKVGYFDISNFQKAVHGHWDYSVRCFNAGFNKLMEQYDIGGSKHYIEMQGKDGDEYIFSPRCKNKVKRYHLSSYELDRRSKLIRDRIKNGKKYISFVKKR